MGEVARLELVQETIDGTSVNDAGKAERELAEASRTLLHKAMQVMSHPTQAWSAIEDAQKRVSTAIAYVNDPASPHSFEAILLMAKANMLLHKTTEALDSESTKTIEDAIAYLGNAIQAISKASSKLS